MTPKSYHLSSRLLHWVMAGLLLFMVFLGWSLDVEDIHRYSRFQLHKSVGITILFLSFLRIGLRLAYKAPPEPPMPGWQALAAKAVHVGFYVLMIGLPLSGWALVSTSSHVVKTVLFGVLPWPNLPLDHLVNKPAHMVHERMAQLLIYGLIPLHVLAALKHHFFDKDETIGHMLPGLEAGRGTKSLLNWRWLIPIGLMAAAFLTVGFLIDRKTAHKEAEIEDAAAVSSVSSTAPVPVTVSKAAEASSIATSQIGTNPTSTKPVSRAWSLTNDNTAIRFTSSFQGTPIKGKLRLISADIDFPVILTKPSEKTDLGLAHAKVLVDLKSVTTGDDERDTTLKGPSFFDVEHYPKAVFEAHRFSISANHFIAHGNLSLHGVTRPVAISFTIGQVETRVCCGWISVNGKAKINRLDFGIGTGEWAATDQIPNNVEFEFNHETNHSKPH